MHNTYQASCVLCGSVWNLREQWYTCPKCGDDGILDVVYDYDAIAKKLSCNTLRNNTNYSMWRYIDLLPVESEALKPHLHVGWTPLYANTSLAQILDIKQVYIKDDGRQPTGSLKDRASAVSIVKGKELQVDTFCAASTGNAASSLAGLGASVGIHPIIFVPKSAPKAKIAQLMIYGATVLAVNGTYDHAFDLSLAAAKKYGWYCRSTAINPVLSEGKKTVLLEILEQLQWQSPDYVVVSVGDGCIIGSLGKALRDCKALGLIEKIPRLIGVQATGSNVIASAFKSGTENITVASSNTVADSISVDKPRDAIKALRAVKESDGLFVEVSDDEILAAIPELGRKSGVFAEPAAAATWAGVKKLRENNTIMEQDSVVLIISGNGLKDIDSAMHSVHQPTIIEPIMADLDREVQSW